MRYDHLTGDVVCSDCGFKPRRLDQCDVCGHRFGGVQTAADLRRAFRGFGRALRRVVEPVLLPVVEWLARRLR